MTEILSILISNRSKIAPPNGMLSYRHDRMEGRLMRGGDTDTTWGGDSSSVIHLGESKINVWVRAADTTSGRSLSLQHRE